MTNWKDEYWENAVEQLQDEVQKREETQDTTKEHKKDD